MKAIYQKEMRQYFHSVIGYVFLAIFVLVNSYYFLLENLMKRSGDITDYFEATITLMMFLMPMLTMRSFSEEKKQRTDILLYTMPMKHSRIVLGKFLAAESVLLLGLAVTVVFPIILAVSGSIQLWITLGNYLGIILLLSTFIAIGIFVSALTENQIVSAVISYVIIFALWFSYGLGSTLQNQAVLTIFNRASMMGMYHEMVMGVLNPAGIMLDLCIIFIFLFLTAMIVGKKRG
ncbi:MAG: ABC transporter permease subunit [Lachnospiraceae bacterium]|nr:ABC transporter permease subunit [Lachnospiraceae bacterium]